MSGRTPLMQQYSSIKNEYADAILLFRMGDFYETFYTDAKKVSKILGITLTARHYKDESIPMAGFPVKSADMYIVRLVKSGSKIAVCEQLEEPKKGVKLVDRGVVEVLTPGTVMRESLLNDRENNYIASYMSGENHYAALSDITTGGFRLIRFDNRQSMEDFLRKTGISEIISHEDDIMPDMSNMHIIPKYHYNEKENERLLKKHFRVSKLSGLGLIHSEGIIAAGVLLGYISDNIKTSPVQINSISVVNDSDYMYMDEQTLRNLEIFTRINGNYDYSFLHVIDRTRTPMGARMLRNHLLHPYLKPEAIEQRLDETGILVKQQGIKNELGGQIQSIGDMERVAARIKTLKAHYRDVIGLKNALGRIPDISSILDRAGMGAHYSLNPLPQIEELIDNALDEQAILKGKKERILREGYNKQYDELRDIAENTLQHIKAMEKHEREETGINTLRIGFNNIAGYYIEVTNANADKVPPEYIWKQSLKNSTRYTTAQLSQYEDAVLHADEELIHMEKELYTGILEQIAGYYDDIRDNASQIASLDMSLSFAQIAVENNYTRPQFSNDAIIIEDGRHPVVEAVEGPGRFVPNSLTMDEKTQIILLTGPNMSGKSTYLRQNALIIYMAHLGMFVPAIKAVIPFTDRIFTRIGASDDISKGVSTFMAEMLESANIINNMTSRSFIILDEIGRGTSTFDGLSIAWAIAEYLHECDERPKTLFATHYHELTELDIKLKRMKNYTTKIKKVKNRVIYLKKIIEGKSDESYGIEVAQMAGFPESIIKNGYMILQMLRENEDNVRQKIRDMDQLKLFEEESNQTLMQNELLNIINNTDLNDITPLESMMVLKRLKDIIKGGK